MLQIDNLNKIKWFRDMFLEFKDYDIDVSSYCDELSLCIEKYENHKNREEENREALLSINGNSEMQLSVDLSSLEFDFQSHILFLDLMHATKTWDYHEDIDEVFDKLHEVVDHKLVEKFSSISTQELIVHKYYDLVFKKIMREYNKENYEYLEQYRHLEKYPYLRDSITHYLEKHYPRLLDEPIELEKVIEGVVGKERMFPEAFVKEDIEEKKKILLPDTPFFRISTIFIFDKFSSLYKMIRRYHDTRKFFSDLKKGRLDFEGEDLSYVDFKNCEIPPGLNLKNTNAQIASYFLESDGLSGCNFEGLDFSKVDFTDCFIKGISLKGTNAHIDPQRVYNKDLSGCNLEGLDFSTADFRGCILDGTNLANTSAFINLFTIGSYDYSTTCLKGCYVFSGFLNFTGGGTIIPLLDDFDRERIIRQVERGIGNFIDEDSIYSIYAPGVIPNLGSVLPEKHDYKNYRFSGQDLTGATFEDCDITGVDFTDAKVSLDPQRVRHKSLEGCKLENVDLRFASFDDVYIRNTNLKNTSSFIDLEKLRHTSLLSTCNFEGCYIYSSSFSKYSDDSIFEGATVITDYDQFLKVMDSIQFCSSDDQKVNGFTLQKKNV